MVKYVITATKNGKRMVGDTSFRKKENAKQAIKKLIKDKKYKYPKIVKVTKESIDRINKTYNKKGGRRK